MGDSEIAHFVYNGQWMGAESAHCTFRDGVDARRAVQPGKGRGFSFSGAGWVQIDPGGPWPLEEILVPHPMGNPTGRGERKLIIDALQILSLQMSVSYNPLITPEHFVQDLFSRDWIESQQFIIIFIFN